MPVITTCHGCGASIQLGARPFDGFTTVCPDCDSRSYHSEIIDGDDRERIIDLATSTPGIGAETAEALAERMVTVERLRTASPSELRNVPGVGSKNGRALMERVSG